MNAVELEIVAPDDKLVKYATGTGLEKPATETLVEAFRPIFAKARAAIDDARGVAESVKDATCVKEIRKSRACRLALKAVRLESENTRKAQKQHALLYGRAVDGFHNILLADLSPVETALQDAEDIAERAEAARKLALKQAREAELFPLLETPFMGDLSDLSEAAYAKTLSDSKLLRQAKIDAAAKSEAERLAREEQARKDREENERLKAEVEKQVAAAKAEREVAEKKLADERAASEVKVAAAKAEAESLRQLEAEKAAHAAAISKRAEAAPDKAKVKVFAGSLRDMARVKLNDESLSDSIWTKVNELADWCDEQAEKI